MKHHIRKNLHFIVYFTVSCILVPSLVLSLLQLEAVSKHFAPVEIMSYSRFFALEWTPFWAVYLAYRRQQKKGSFSPLPVLGYVLSAAIMMLQCDFLSFPILACNVGLLLTMESFALLKKLPKKGFLSGIRANRKLLRAFFFWEIATLSIIHISCLGMQAIVMPLILIPVPGILLISAFRQLNDKPPRAGGILGILAMVPVTVWLCSIGPMALYKLYFLLIMLGGYVMFFLLQLIYHADRFKKTK